ncbi:MAG TPA: glycosyltransferase family 4 protein [Candidatus Acidoferrales bacterium]|nr:glycosyltransferase family 4 protein [Candidatus Acidoferrales bacterium]
MNRVLGYVTPVRAFNCSGAIYMQSASGRVAESLARHYDKIYVCTRVVHGAPPAPFDFPLNAPNLEIIAQPFWNSTAGSIPHFFGIARSYVQVCRRADVLFVRGMCPYIAVLYLCAAVYRKPICHWIVGDPITLLKTSGRNGPVLDMFGHFYALQDRAFTRLGRWLTGGTLICNGRELARAYASPRTIEVVSSTIREDEFSPRGDTCLGPLVRILFVGFIRPEKGIEYLLDALTRLKGDVSWELEIIGPSDFPEYRRQLDDLIAARRITRRVRWSGYVPYGQPLFDRMRAADLLVLPTLSEGTPHVLVEARANGLPCISTTVGGVPSTVTDGHDALLVPPKDSQALCRAIERVIFDGNLRRTLIRNGFGAARNQSLDRFIATVLQELEAGLRETGAAVPQE